MSTYKRAFTLIELLVVISIISILISVGVVSYLKSIKVSRDSKRKTDLEQLRQALETYRSEEGSYPATATWSSDLVGGDYISAIPSDPKNGTYTYTKGTGATYTLCASLELGTPPEGVCNYSVNEP